MADYVLVSRMYIDYRGPNSRYQNRAPLLFRVHFITPHYPKTGCTDACIPPHPHLGSMTVPLGIALYLCAIMLP